MSATISQAIELARLSIQTRVPVFFAGATGVGKSSTVKNAIQKPLVVPITDGQGNMKYTGKGADAKHVFKTYTYRMQSLRMASKDETDVEGIPFIDEAARRTVYARPENIVDFNASYEEVPPTVYFCDEINRWPGQVRQTLMSAFFDNDGEGRYLGDHRIRDLDVFVCAFNPSADGYDVEDLDQALLCRGVQIAVEGSGKEWRRWAIKSGIDGDLVEFFASGENFDLSTEFTPQTKKNPRTAELGARAYMLHSQLPKEERCGMNELVMFIGGLIGSQAETLVAFLNEKSERPISAIEMMDMKKAALVAYLKTLKSKSRNDVFTILKDNMDNHLMDCVDGLNKRESEQVMTFLENIPKDILSTFLTEAMASGTNTGHLFNNLAADPNFETRMDIAMQEAMALGAASK